MSAHHGNTPAAWTAVVVGLVGFTVGGVGLMFDPVNMTVFWVGVGDHRGRRRGLRGHGPARHGRPLSAAHVTALAAPPEPPATRGRRMLAPALTIGGLAARHRWRCTCATRTSTAAGASARARPLGFYCPGCGGLRAVNDLTHGDVGAALSSNLARAR